MLRGCSSASPQSAACYPHAPNQPRFPAEAQGSEDSGTGFEAHHSYRQGSDD
jgi:hypothetical protein